MKELKNSGLPLYIDEETHVMAISALLPFDGYSRKYAGQMKGLWASDKALREDEPVYDVYRGLAFEADTEKLAEYDFRYDITIVLPGTVNGERKKTSGHYHGYNPARTNTYAEVYEVIAGTALYVLQKSGNFDTDPENIQLDDIILARVEEGQTIIIPPNYGHCSLNVGGGPLVFSNLAYVPTPVLYDPVKKYHGMSWYAMQKGGEVEYAPNPRHKAAPAAKHATVKENPRLGIQFGLPVYQSFLQNPAAFEFLRNPDIENDAIMDMLVYRA